MNIGEKFTFQIKSGRGRPYVGEVVRKMGIFTEMKLRNGEIVRINTKNIKNAYEFKPYKKSA